MRACARVAVSVAVEVNVTCATAFRCSLTSPCGLPWWPYLKLYTPPPHLFFLSTTNKSLACVLSCFSCVQLFAALWAIAHQAPLSMGFSRQGYWSPPPWDLSDPGSNLRFFHLHWQVGSLPLMPPGKPNNYLTHSIVYLFLNIDLFGCIRS